jgi:PRC-barrel domain
MAHLEKLDETTSLISAGKVTGTPVYSTEGERLGEINDVMLDKRSGKIAYAVMSFGGFLGLGERYHPLPWATLKYDTRQQGYVVGLTIDQLRQAPTFAADQVSAWGDRAYESHLHAYYQATPYWAV